MFNEGVSGGKIQGKYSTGRDYAGNVAKLEPTLCETEVAEPT